MSLRHTQQKLYQGGQLKLYQGGRRFESSCQKSLAVAIKHPFVKIDGGSEACVMCKM